MSNGGHLQTNGNRLLVDEIHEQFLMCQICSVTYQTPKNLSCLHTFCLRCIEKTHDNEMSSRKYGDPRDVTCPVCRKRTQLPVGGARNLTDNFLVINLAQLVEKQKVESEKKPHFVCDICKEDNSKPDSKKKSCNPSRLTIKRKSFMSDNVTIRSAKSYESASNDESVEMPNGEVETEEENGNFSQCNGDTNDSSNSINNPNIFDDRASSDDDGSTSQKSAVSKCLECNKMLCRRCIKKHRAMKVTSRHSMIDIETEKDVECKEHPGEPVRFYCDRCQQCVCVLCAFNAHRDHDVEHFSDAAGKNREPLTKLIDICEDKVSEFNNIFEGLTSLEANMRDVQEKIREVSSELVMKIRQQERHLIESIRSEFDSKVFDYIENKNDLTLQMETLKNTCSLARVVVESNDVEMLLLKKEVEDKLATLSQVGLKELPEGVLKKELVFLPGQADLGKIATKPSQN